MQRRKEAMRHSLEDKKQKPIHTSSKPVIFVVISILVVALIYSPSTTFYVFAAPPALGFESSYAKCVNSPETLTTTCCWEYVIGTGVMQCQTCSINLDTGDFENCTDPQIQRITPPTAGETVPPGEGVLEQPPTPPTPPLTPRGAPPLGEIAPEAEQPPTPPLPTPRTPGQSVLPGEGVLQQPPADGATQPQDVEEEPLCPEGQILDEETGLCVLEEQEAVEEPEPVEEPEEQPSEEEADSSEDNNSNN